MQVVDEVGIDALSMRKVAHRLGVPVMNLYHYVQTKDEVLDRIADRALAEIAPAAVGSTWDERLTHLFRMLHSGFLAHPGLAALFADRAVSGTSAYRAADTALEVLLEAGFPEGEAVDAFTSLLTYTLGASLFAIARSPQSPSAAEKLRLTRLSQAGPDDFPALARVRDHLQVRGTREQFEYGLEHLVEGLRQSAASRAET